MQVICCTHSYLFLEKMNLLGEAEVAVAVAVAAVAAAAAAALAFGTLEQACHGVVGVPEHCHQ
jgi:3-dehydroquinate synthase class II